MYVEAYTAYMIVHMCACNIFILVSLIALSVCHSAVLICNSCLGLMCFSPPLLWRPSTYSSGLSIPNSLCLLCPLGAQSFLVSAFSLVR